MRHAFFSSSMKSPRTSVSVGPSSAACAATASSATAASASRRMNLPLAWWALMTRSKYFASSSGRSGCSAGVSTSGADTPTASASSFCIRTRSAMGPWQNRMACRSSSSETSRAWPSSIVTALSVPATMRFIVLCSSSMCVGFSTNSSPIFPTRTAPVGPRKGIS